MTIVDGYGKTPNDVMLVGEAPGAVEASKGKPFVGPAGSLQRKLLSIAGLEQRTTYRTNLVKLYVPGNPDPSPEMIEVWEEVLLDEIAECRPKVILSIGAFATRWFLGASARLSLVHGMPHAPGAFDPSIAHRVPEGTIIVPVHHPAGALYDDGKGGALGTLYWDYLQAVEIITRRRREVVTPLQDQYKGRETYLDVSGSVLAHRLSDSRPSVVGFDTEGPTDNPWSIQISDEPGVGYVLRRSQPDFQEGIDALQDLADQGCLFVALNLLYDVEACRSMGMELRRAKLCDLMAMVYPLRSELEQNLKAVSWRWSGMEMQEFEEISRAGCRARQLEYLEEVSYGEWDDPDPRAIQENDGSTRIYTPEPISRSAKRILSDLASGKVTKEGPVDPEKRWDKIDDAQKAAVRRDLGPFPSPRVEDVPLEDMIPYAARDADAARRNYLSLVPVLESRDLLDVVSSSMDVFPVFEEMNGTGFPADRQSFQDLHDELDARVFKLSRRLSKKYFGGQPFNPNSGPQVRKILKRRKLKPAKVTKKTREPSTSQDSLKHLEHEDDFVQDLFSWRELQHLRDSFCRPILDRIPEAAGTYWIRGRLKWTRTATRRLAYEDPNLLNIPTRTSEGRRVRSCFVAPEGMLLGSSDLSQIEARVLAHLSQDPLLLELFNSGADIHIETAARIFETPPDQVTKEQRTAAKTINYGTIYGQQATGLKIQLGKLGIIWPRDRCSLMLDRWYQTYEGVKEYGEAVFEEASRTGEVRDLGGMPRWVVGVWLSDEYTREEAKRVAVSHIVQGTAQTMIQNSMIWLKPRVWELQDEGYEVKNLLQYHDELLFAFETAVDDRLGDLVVEALTEHSGVELSVPVEAEWSSARSWGDLK